MWYINKKTNEFKLVQILNKYFPDILLETLSECANEIIQTGYVQLQADSDRVVSKAVSEALSANNAKWREKIEERNGFCELGGGINICISEEQWQSILSEMEEE